MHQHRAQPIPAFLLRQLDQLYHELINLVPQTGTSHVVPVFELDLVDLLHVTLEFYLEFSFLQILLGVSLSDQCDRDAILQG